ncbi:MAG: DeoR/GlpR family DNA-binding transcription regulator [Kiritimatiellia bacterium]|nr:DeoR/GlpR family DNA-binding transcription regulator [Kiritimatiellia bacterium]
MKFVNPAVQEDEGGLPAERAERICDMLRDRHVLSNGHLAREMGVTPVTIRRDLIQLEKQGRIRRVHGGAVLLDSAWQEQHFDDKTETASVAKRAIAQEAARRIGRGESVYLDGGSTVLALARLLRDRSDLTVVTNSFRAALELSTQGPRLVLIGGELRRMSQTMVGPMSRFVLESLHVDQAFMGTIGLTIQDGMTTTEPQEAFTKEWAMRQARNVTLLADVSKFHVRSFARSGSIRDIDVLITNRMDTKMRSALKKFRLEIVETGEE